VNTGSSQPQSNGESTAAAQCNLCGGERLYDFFEMLAAPVHVCILAESPDAATRAPRGDVRLAFCLDCGHVFNRAFDPGKLFFDSRYDASLAFSHVFTQFIDSVANRLGEQYELRGKDVIEVGCGDGFFLRKLAARGNRCVGFDPSRDIVVRERVGDGQVTLIPEYYTTAHRDVPCDFLCCLSVMEDFERPVEFVSDLGRILGDRTTPGYFEVFNGYGAIERQHSWSILYEQCNYFSAETFAQLFRRAGFEIARAGNCYEGDQYAYVEASWPGRSKTETEYEPIAHAGSPPPEITSFQKSHAENLNVWTERLNRWRENNRRVVVWGTGGKGVNFLNSLPAHGVQFAVDINPRRQGLFVPGSGQEIVGPEFLRDYQPHAVVITNPLYEREIRRAVASQGVSCEFVAT
jgi:SAM-dependent methyltransferase